MTTRVKGLTGYVWITCKCGKQVQRNADLFSVRYGHVTDGAVVCGECRSPLAALKCGEPVWDPTWGTVGGWVECSQASDHTGSCTP